MRSWKERLTEDLEPLLGAPDPRPKISVYHDTPCAIFHYPPQEEFAVREELSQLVTRLEAGGKRVKSISLAECLEAALEAEGMTAEKLAEAEIATGVEAMIETLHEVLSSYQPLDELVTSRMPEDGDPHRDLVFIERGGALYPLYRLSSLVDHLKGKIELPTILFYPGIHDGTGLRAMGVLDAEHNYRGKIF